MFVYEKKLQYPVRIANPNPKLAAFIISQYGGPDGFWIYKFLSSFVCKKRVPEKPDTLFYDDVQSMAGRSSPMKNTATVPGPLWDPMMVPMSHRRILPFSLGKRSSRASISIRASSGH
jgi:hypothetical protein